MTNAYSPAARTLIDATIAVAQQGIPLMHRVVDPAVETMIWDHYPADDAVDRGNGYRWFYHAHPPGERMTGEHGHFHIFAEKARMNGTPLACPPPGETARADVVHLIALSIDMQGLPMQLFTVNRWVTDESLYPADALADALDHFALDDAQAGDALVNAWLVAAIRFFRTDIAVLIASRDAVIASWDDPAAAFEDRNREIVSAQAIDLDHALAQDGVASEQRALRSAEELAPPKLGLF